jgi:hypothetical protein
MKPAEVVLQIKTAFAAFRTRKKGMFLVPLFISQQLRKGRTKYYYLLIFELWFLKLNK